MAAGNFARLWTFSWGDVLCYGTSALSQHGYSASHPLTAFTLAPHKHLSFFPTCSFRPITANSNTTSLVPCERESSHLWLQHILARELREIPFRTHILRGLSVRGPERSLLYKHGAIGALGFSQRSANVACRQICFCMSDTFLNDAIKVLGA